MRLLKSHEKIIVRLVKEMLGRINNPPHIEYWDCYQEAYLALLESDFSVTLSGAALSPKGCNTVGAALNRFFYNHQATKLSLKHRGNPQQLNDNYIYGQNTIVDEIAPEFNASAILKGLSPLDKELAGRKIQRQPWRIAKNWPAIRKIFVRGRKPQQEEKLLSRHDVEKAVAYQQYRMKRDIPDIPNLERINTRHVSRFRYRILGLCQDCGNNLEPVSVFCEDCTKRRKKRRVGNACSS